MISSGKYTGAAVPALEQAARFQTISVPTLLSPSIEITSSDTLRTKHTVLFACREGGLAEKARERGVPVTTELTLPAHAAIWHYWRDMRRIQDLVETWKPDVILTHRSPEMLTAGLAARGRVPVVRVWHAGRGDERVWMLRRVTRALNIQVAGTSSLAGCLFPNPHVRTETPIFRSAVDTDFFNPDRVSRTLRTELGMADDEVLVGTVARWKEGRGLDACISEMAALCHAEPRVRGVLIGRGELERLLRDMIRLKGMENRIHLITTDAYREALASLDIGTLFAPGSDGSSRAVLEMAAMRLPVVLMRRGALADFSTYDGMTCVDYASEWVKACQVLVQNREQRRRAGEAARETILRLHTPPCVVYDDTQQLCHMVDVWRRSQTQRRGEKA